MMKIEGLPVIDVDESEKITVAVRADDLLEGDTGNPDRHPIAIALRRQGDVDDARVTKNETLVRRGKKWFRYDAPDKRLFKQLQKTLMTAGLGIARVRRKPGSKSKIRRRQRRRRWNILAVHCWNYRWQSQLSRMPVAATGHPLLPSVESSGPLRSRSGRHEYGPA